MASDSQEIFILVLASEKSAWKKSREREWMERNEEKARRRQKSKVSRYVYIRMLNWSKKAFAANIIIDVGIM